MLQIANFAGVGDDYTHIASLSHTVILHQESAGLSLVDEFSRTPYQFIGEERIDHIGHGRGLACWRLFRDDGLHIASTFQDGLMRFPKEGQKGNAAAQFDGGGKGKL
jgi:acyl-CoA thioesterase